MFYSNFMSLCEEAGVAPSNVLTELAIGRAGLKRWREGQEPSNPIKKKIADYFGITVKQLMEDDKEEAPAKEAEADEMAELLETIRRRPDLRVLFSLSAKATPEDVKDTIKIIKALSGDDDGTDNY